MPGRHDVYVFEDDGVYYVRPGVAMVVRDAGVKVRNLTDHHLDLRLNGGHGLVWHVEPHSGATFAIPDVLNGIYDYRVDVILVADTVKVPALGNSFPKIIVDP
jgi:hypothetical protein